MKKHYETHVEDTDKLISVAGPVLDYKSWYEQYRKLMEEQAQRKYGLYTPTSEGDDDDFPSISGVIARYSALGLTNEQMAANPVWVDKTGNGHDLQMKNLAWGGMSGVNGYKFNFLSNGWVIDNNQVSEKYSYKIVINDKKNSVQFYRINSEHIKIILKITGIEINKSTFRVYDNAGTEHAQNYTKDGIYEIDYTANEGANMIYFYVFGGNTRQLENPITIEQLPLYPGALVFDGVDDYGTCDNFPILTKEKGYTVVALRQWITRGEIAQGLVSNVKNWLKDGAFLLEYRNIQAEHLNKPISFGAIGSEMDLPHILTYQTSKSYNGVSITTGNFEGTDVLHVGKLAPTNVGTCINAAIWELVFLDHDATEEELTKIKDYFVKTYPWLFPDQAWTVTGKTNEDEDRATIANITGNGNDLVLSNFAFSGNSGYGEYAYNFSDTSWISISDYGVISDKTSKSFNIKSFVLADYPVLYTAVNKDSSIKKVKIKVTNSIPGFYFGNKPANQIIDLSTDGIYEIPSYNSPNDVTQYGFRCSNVNDSCNITIEQIPEYEGYLVTDGVDDKITSSAFEMGKDFTVVGEWRFIIDERKVAGLIKPPSFYLFNENNGLKLFINNTEKSSSLNTKSLKAICSDGRVYFDDWSEMLLSEEQPITSSSKDLSIGYNSTIYTQMAFKNLGIYNNQLLSKDDCIKAYNYLQTLKAK